MSKLRQSKWAGALKQSFLVKTEREKSIELIKNYIKVFSDQCSLITASKKGVKIHLWEKYVKINIIRKRGVKSSLMVNLISLVSFQVRIAQKTHRMKA